PSPYWGEEPIWTSRNNVHNPMLDDKGRVWITSAVRPAANPDACKDPSHPSAKLYPLANAGRHLAVYDPKTKQITHVSSCFGTHHLMFAMDANNQRWRASSGLVAHEHGRPDARRDEVAGLDGPGARHQRQWQTRRLRGTESTGRSDQGQAAWCGLLCGCSGARWIDLGFGAWIPRLGGAVEPRIESARNGARGDLRAAVQQSESGSAGVFAARRRRRSQRRLLDGARQRPSRQLRSPQMQRASERADRNRAALSGRLDALSGAVAAAERRYRVGQRRSQLLHVGRLVRHRRLR